MSYPSVCDRLVIVLGPSWRSNFVDVLIRFARCLLGCPRYGVYDDASCSDQDSSVTVLGLFAFCSGICVVCLFIERRLCPLDATAPSATGA